MKVREITAMYGRTFPLEGYRAGRLDCGMTVVLEPDEEHLADDIYKTLVSHCRVLLTEQARELGWIGKNGAAS